MKVELCPVRHAVVVGREAHRLPDLSFRLLDLLVSRSPDPVSFSEIEQAVWNAQVTRETIKQRVTLLRDSLEQVGLDGAAIEAVRNQGYRTSLQMSVVEPAGAASQKPRIAWVAGIIITAIGVALMLAWQLRDAGTSAKPVLAVVLELPVRGTDPAEAEALRRDVVRTISKFEGVEVIDRVPASGFVPDYLVRIWLDGTGFDRTLSAEFVDRPNGTILFAEKYAVSPANAERVVLHFANNLHAAMSALSISRGRISDDARARIAEAYRLWRLGDRQSLIGARKSLEGLSAEPEARATAQSLLARVQADLVLRYGEPVTLARQAERDVRALIARQPGVGDLRYSLARTLLAQGKRDAALNELRAAQRTMPFLVRDILALEHGPDLARGTANH